MYQPNRIISLLLLVIFSAGCSPRADEKSMFRLAKLNGEAARESFQRCDKYLDGWLELSDPDSGLFPRSTEELFWNAKDSAADNYPFMILTAFFTDKDLFQGRMLDVLETETRLTSRINSLPDTYDFTLKGFQSSEPDLGSIIFGSSEYVKDGLLPVTELLGPSPWADRMLSILDDMWKNAFVTTPRGKIVSNNVEINGEMLQVLSRVYWMTGDPKYLEWAVRLGDYYLLGDNHPTSDFARLRLRDHGCEIISGLCELYAAVHFAMPEKKREYQAPLHQMLDRVLEVGRNEHGLFYNAIDPGDGSILKKGIADTWGYTLNGFYTVYLIDRKKSYRRATLKALSSINGNYRNYDWERGNPDGFADSIESALNLYNREPVESAASWIDSEIKVMWSKQQADGLIEGRYLDGNFARTSIMYALWKTQGARPLPWREDLVLGAVPDDQGLRLYLRADKEWTGKVIFDEPRHRTIMHLPLDWPRINQFPEWFTVNDSSRYSVTRYPDADPVYCYSGEQLREGLPVNLTAGEEQRLVIIEAD